MTQKKDLIECVRPWREGKVTLRYQLDLDTGCHLWRGAISRYGYGVASSKRQTFRAHRVAYELSHGPVPAGMHLDHLCRCRHCINPAHLEPVTPAENTRRGAKTKLVPSDISEIRKLALSGLSQREIGERFGIDRSHVSRIHHQNRWVER